MKKVELHHFSDASTEGYGQCSYLSLVDTSDQVHCSLVMSKAAALVSVRVLEIEEVFWTDSKVVQAYIHNDARRFHTFVANQVQQISDRTVPEQWNYVDRKNNPADDAFRGLSPKDLLQSSRWLQGPSFLWNHHDSWKDVDKGVPEPLKLDDQIKK